MNRKILGVFFLASFSVQIFGQQAGESVTKLYQDGLKAQNDEAYYSAIETYRDCLAKNPVYMEPLVGLSECYFALAEYDEALIYIRKARTLDMNRIPLMILEGRIHIGLGNFEEASRIFSAVSSREPNNTDAELGFAELALAQGKIEVAKSRFLETIRMNPENRRALLSLIILYDNQNDFAKGEEYCKLALSLYPSDPEVRLVVASHYLSTGRLGEAEGHVKFALSIKPQLPEGLRMYSTILLETGRYQEGAEVLARLLQISRDQPIVWHNLAVTQMLLGRNTESLNAYRTALQLKPDDETVRYAYEFALIDQTEMKSPLRISAAQYHFSRANGFKGKNLSEKALREYRRGLMVDPYSKEGRLGYAQIFLERRLYGKYVEELKILTENGLNDRNIDDSLEIHESLLQTSVSSVWGIDQYMLEKSSYSFSLFYNTGSQPLGYFQGENVLTRVLSDNLRGYENISLKSPQRRVSSFAEAFRMARTEGTDYFTVFSFVNGDRFFTVKAQTFLSSTGVELSTVTVQRTGNDRVQDALYQCAANIHAQLPVFGRILDRKFDSVVVDIGSRDGIASGNTLVIIKNRELRLQKDTFGYVYDEKDLIGEFTVTKPDELISEGTVKSSSFFDMINPGDYIVFRLPSPPQEPPPQQEKRNILQRLFRLK